MSNRYKMFILLVWVELGFCATIFVTLVMITVFENVSFKKKDPRKNSHLKKNRGKNSRKVTNFFFNFGAKIQVFDRKSFELLLKFWRENSNEIFQTLCDDGLGFYPELDFKSAKS